MGLGVYGGCFARTGDVPGVGRVDPMIHKRETMGFNCRGNGSLLVDRIFPEMHPSVIAMRLPAKQSPVQPNWSKYRSDEARQKTSAASFFEP